MHQSFIFHLNINLQVWKEKKGRKQVSSSPLMFIHHKDDTRRVVWYILYIILWYIDHFSNRKAIHIAVCSHLDITFWSD